MAYLYLFFSLSAIVYYCFAIYASILFFKFNPTASEASLSPGNLESCSPATLLPPVTILKPVCGADRNTYDNLASFCRQIYPTYQIIFGIQSQSDLSIPIIQKLIQDFPQLDIQYVISDRTIGTNLKVSNLANAAVQAKYDILILADSDIYVGIDYLQRVVQPLSNPAVGVITCMYRSRAEGRIAAFEALSISTEFLPSVLVARQLEGMAFALGATIVIRKSVLDAIGGFSAVADYLGDDFQLGHQPALAGYRVVLSGYIVDHIMTTETWADLLHHQTRWMRGTRFSRPVGYLGLIFTHGIMFSLLFLLSTHGSGLGWAVLSATWITRYTMAGLIGVNYLEDTVAQKWLWLVPLRDLMSFALWCYSFTGDRIEWRGRKMRLTQGGKLVSIPLSE